MGWFGSLQLAYKYAIVFGSLLAATLFAGGLRLLYDRRRLKKFVKKDQEAASSTRRDDQVELNTREKDEGDLFGIQAIQAGYTGGVPQSRPSSSAGSIFDKPSRSTASSTTLIGSSQSPKIGIHSANASVGTFDLMRPGSSNDNSTGHGKRKSPPSGLVLRPSQAELNKTTNHAVDMNLAVPPSPRTSTRPTSPSSPNSPDPNSLAPEAAQGDTGRFSWVPSPTFSRVERPEPAHHGSTRSISESEPPQLNLPEDFNQPLGSVRMSMLPSSSPQSRRESRSRVRQSIASSVYSQDTPHSLPSALRVGSAYALPMPNFTERPGMHSRHHSNISATASSPLLGSSAAFEPKSPRERESWPENDRFSDDVGLAITSEERRPSSPTASNNPFRKRQSVAVDPQRLSRMSAFSFVPSERGNHDSVVEPNRLSVISGVSVDPSIDSFALAEEISRSNSLTGDRFSTDAYFCAEPDQIGTAQQAEPVRRGRSSDGSRVSVISVGRPPSRDLLNEYHVPVPLRPGGQKADGQSQV